MGISGLLPGLKSIACTTGNIRDFANQSVAVDASSWLHKAVYSIADHYVETLERSGTVDSRCVSSASAYMAKRCRELLDFANIQRIYLVMDGRRCPLKAPTNQERERRRVENLEKAREYRRLGQNEKMYDKYKACIKVCSELARAVAREITKRLDKNRVFVVWSPYEADAQLVAVCTEGLAQAIITEDSDVLVYSATCRKPVPIIFKLDRNSGKCDVFSMDWLWSASKISQVQKKKSAGLDTFLRAFAMREERKPGLGVRLFVQSCVFAGCDYAPNDLEGIGTVTAFKHVRQNLHRDDSERFTSMLNDCSQKTSQDYATLLSKSEAVFYYHPVLRVGLNQVQYFNDPNRDEFHRPCLDLLDSDWSSFLGDCSLTTASQRPTSSGATSGPKTSFGIPRSHQTGPVSNPYLAHKEATLGRQGPAAVLSMFASKPRAKPTIPDWASKKHTPPRPPMEPKRTSSNNLNGERKPPLQPSSPNSLSMTSKNRGEGNLLGRYSGKSLKRPRFDLHRTRTSPLQPSSPNTKPASSLPQNKEGNLFARFLFQTKSAKTDDDSLRPSWMKAEATDGDIRFVKRKFPVDGSRTHGLQCPLDPDGSKISPESTLGGMKENDPIVIDEDGSTAQAVSQSRFFCATASPKRRRVTLEPDPEFQCEARPLALPSDRAKPTELAFDMYDDFMSPTKTNQGDEALTSSETSLPSSFTTRPNLRRVPQKGQTMGPAKTLRPRFGESRKKTGKPSAVIKKSARTKNQTTLPQMFFNRSVN